jgi:hypothetical protein
VPACLAADPEGKRKDRLMEIFGGWNHHGELSWQPWQPCRCWLANLPPGAA